MKEEDRMRGRGSLSCTLLYPNRQPPSSPSYLFGRASVHVHIVECSQAPSSRPYIASAEALPVPQANSIKWRM